MYLIGQMARRNRNQVIFDIVKNSAEAEQSKIYISEALPPAIASAIGPEVLEQIRSGLLKHPGDVGKVRLEGRDVKKSVCPLAVDIYFYVPHSHSFCPGK